MVRSNLLFLFSALLAGASGQERSLRASRVLTTPKQQDQITSLPGLNYDPGFKQYAGYLDASPTRHIFYWYVESQNDPKTDPVVLWTNGGPGCSGLLGFGTEHGPFYISQSGVLSNNPYSWNKNASMLYIEQPAGVGFSTYDTPQDKYSNDTQAAQDMYSMILAFLDRFPARKPNDFYIASESYGGHYMPQLALEILKQDTTHQINFQGFMVGNPYVDPFTNGFSQFEAYYGRGLIAKPLYDEFLNRCSTASDFNTQACTNIQNQITQNIGSGINPYALDYPVCTQSAATTYEESAVSSQAAAIIQATGQNPPVLSQQDNYKPCAQQNLETYLNRLDVQQALRVHIPSGQKTRQWNVCGNIEYSSADINTPVIDLYQELIQGAVAGDHNLNMLVYSGDDDSVCSLQGTQDWIWSLGVSPYSTWHQWVVDKQTAGFFTKYDLGTETQGKFTLATVHGAGHEVPAYKPMEASVLFQKFLAGKW